MRDYYEVLGVRRDAGADEIRRACRRLAPRFHPDISDDEPVISATWHDDVAIDFPSASDVLDRMRAAFFGRDRAAPREADVVLTKDEARDGADVPLVVPVRLTCPACGGRGEVWSTPCETCFGAGDAIFPHHVMLQVPAGVREGARFRVRVSGRRAAAMTIDVRIAIA